MHTIKKNRIFTKVYGGMVGRRILNR